MSGGKLERVVGMHPIILAMSRAIRWERRFLGGQHPGRDSAPGRTDRLSHDHGFIRSRSWPKLLRPSIVHLGDVDIAILADAHSMHVPHGAGPLAAAAP